jgi:hypothetical protein
MNLFWSNLTRTLAFSYHVCTINNDNNRRERTNNIEQEYYAKPTNS